MTFNSSLTILKRQIKSHKRQGTQTNCKRRTTKAVLVAAESTDPRTSITKDPFIPNKTGEIVGRSQKTSNPPLQEEGGGQELTANVNELTNIGTLQVSNFESNVENIKQWLLFKIQCFKAGNLRKFYSRWTDLTSDPEVLNTEKGQCIEFTTNPYQDRVPSQKKFSVYESTVIQPEINKLLQKEVIIPTSNEPVQFISTIFLPPKPDGTHRMILNLKLFNKSVKYEHFKMDTLWTVIRMMKPNCYMASIDIKDVYYSVPIAATNQKYLKFEWKGKLHKFTCFPNVAQGNSPNFSSLLTVTLDRKDTFVWLH